MVLPEEFERYTRELMGEERFARYLAAFDEEPPVSIRLNPKKTLKTLPRPLSVREGSGESLSPVPWCRDAYYLDHRPNFTFDPLLHAGCYYVQEAASMFLDTVLHQYLPEHPVMMLDMCAAPGGKSTLARAVLPEGSVLFSNEPMRQRANILLENITKWGYPDCFVTNNYPKDYRKSRLKFDVILCDVPCSGEGMFRKDAATIGEWSPQNVERCAQLQRDIVSDAWACLNDGGLLVYSTCTFNTKENEENIRWMMDELDACVLPVETQTDWQITGSLLAGFNEPVYRFIPGITHGEGLFMCVLRKGGTYPPVCRKQTRSSLTVNNLFAVSKPGLCLLEAPALRTDGPSVDLSYQQAIAYLRREALVLPPETPRGLVQVSFLGYPLGLVKNIGSRANNLYPKEWAIRSTHVPQTYEPIIIMEEQI